MSRILNAASVAAVGLTVAATLLLAEPGFATDLGADANTPVIPLPGAETPLKAETADLSTDATVAPLTPDSIDQTDPDAPEPAPVTLAIGTQSCRERVCQHVYLSGVAVTIRHKQPKHNTKTNT